MILKILCFIYLLLSLNAFALFHILREKLGFEEKYYCIRGLVSNYGLEGTRYAEKLQDKFQMCPNISFSCCKFSDQKIMYENWVLNNEQEQIVGRIEFYAKVYEEVLDLIVQIQAQAN